MSPVSYTFLSCLNDIRDDLKFYGGNKGVAKFVVFLFHIPFKLMFWYRISRYLYLKKHKSHPFHIFIRYRLGTLGGNDISHHASIGKRISLPHPSGIFIGNGVIVMDNVTIYQQVTLGSHGKPNQIIAYPIIQSGVKIFSGAVIIGGITVGENAIIGANSVVLCDVSANTTFAGIPARNISP